jgi:hypothetical protein
MFHVAVKPFPHGSKRQEVAGEGFTGPPRNRSVLTARRTPWENLCFDDRRPHLGDGRLSQSQETEAVRCSTCAFP